MKGKKAKYKWMLTFKSKTARTNKFYYNKKADALHDLKKMKTKHSDTYKNPRISKI